MLPFAEPGRPCAEHVSGRTEQNSTGDMTFETVQAGCLVGQKKWGSEAECDLETKSGSWHTGGIQTHGDLASVGQEETWLVD